MTGASWEAPGRLLMVEQHGAPRVMRTGEGDRDGALAEGGVGGGGAVEVEQTVDVESGEDECVGEQAHGHVLHPDNGGCMQHQASSAFGLRTFLLSAIMWPYRHNH